MEDVGNDRVFREQEFSNLSLKESFVKAHGKDTWDLAKKLEDVYVKLGKCNNHVVFNLQCKKMDLVPRSLQFRSPVPSFRARKIMEGAGHQLVRERLRLSELRKKELEE